MTGVTALLLFSIIIIVLAYHRASLIIWILASTLFLVIVTRFSGFSLLTLGVCWTLFFVIFLPLILFPFRRRFISARLLNFYRRVMPSMSRTEREALSAGTVTWEGDLFCGKPHWEKLLALPPAKLNKEEQAFLDGPVETLCSMIDDWDITHQRLDLPPAVWAFIKAQGFFGLIIPKQYGGKAFSAYAHSQILIKIGGRSATVATTVAVPNSLGPAELLLHYGTPEQKNYYLPRLASGEEIPCFALSSMEAGSDASAMTDTGIVAWGEHQGVRTLGIRLNWSKRYITLAPIATVIGLAFKLYDPEHLLGEKEDIGISCALIPRHTAGITIGRRHFPLNTPFQNGPIQGKDVFIPLDWLIGGVEKAGSGWRMLMECLAAGRAISLPANALGSTKVLAYATGAYARIRKQFNLPIGRFEGIEQALAPIAAYTYIMDAARTFAASSIDAGAKPSVASAIVKYQVTELGRKAMNHAMDIHGGKGICLGPHNYLGRSYESTPIAITVEGANILTRNLIIFGQGAIRCHPYVFLEMEAARSQDSKQSLKIFDKLFFKHLGFAFSNLIRTLILALTSSYLVKTPKNQAARYYQHATRFSSALAWTADAAMWIVGASLKRKENISARLGDVLSYLYLMSAVLKHFHDQGSQSEDYPLVQFALKTLLYEIQERFSEIFKNFPQAWAGRLLHFIVFPLGRHFSKPKDQLYHTLSQLLMGPTESRLRLADGAYLGNETVLADIQDALLKTLASEPIENIIKKAVEDGRISGYTMKEQIQSALSNQVISESEFDTILRAESARKKVIAVDDFSAEEL